MKMLLGKKKKAAAAAAAPEAPAPEPTQVVETEMPDQAPQVDPVLQEKYIEFKQENPVYTADEFDSAWKAEVSNLLFAILQELKKLNEE